MKDIPYFSCIFKQDKHPKNTTRSALPMAMWCRKNFILPAFESMHNLNEMQITQFQIISDNIHFSKVGKKVLASRKVDSQEWLLKSA